MTIQSKITYISIVIAAIAILLFLQQCNNTKSLKAQLAASQQNTQATLDSIRMEKDKIGRDEYDKLVYLTDRLSNLEKLNMKLYTEIGKVKGKVLTITKTNIKFVHDTTRLIVSTTLIDSIIRMDFKYDTIFNPGNFRKLGGYTKHNFKNNQSYAELSYDEIGISFTTGIKNMDKGKPEIFLKSDYPNFTVTALEGAVLDPNLFKAKTFRKLTIGINVGYSPLYYNLTLRKLGLANQVTAGIGINYRIL